MVSLSVSSRVHCSLKDIYDGIGRATKTLCSLSLVHRTWTHSAQMALGCAICVADGDRLIRLLGEGRSLSIIGPWTTCISITCLDTFESTVRQHSSAVAFFMRIARNLRYLYINASSTFPSDWANSMLGEIIRQTVALQDLTLYFPYIAGGNEANSPINDVDLCKRLKYLSINLDAEYPGLEFHAELPSLRELVFMFSVDGAIHTFTSLLSCISSQPDSPFESLTLCYVNSTTVTRMEEEDLFAKYATLWSRVRQLHYYGRGHSLPLMAKYCTNLHELSFSMDISQPSPRFLNLPPTVQILRIHLPDLVVHELHIEPSAELFLLDIGSRMIPSLHSLYVNRIDIRHISPHVFATEDQLLKKLKTKCDTSGLHFVLTTRSARY